jgi:two-component sensor histidine kinase
MARCLTEMCALVLALSLPLAFPAAAQTNEPIASPTNGVSAPARPVVLADFGVGSWIWADRTFDQQTCRLWRAFEIPRAAVVKQARLRMTADNSFVLWIDGQEIGRGGEWRTLSEYDVTSLLGPGTHVLAVEVFNDYAEAGMLLGLRIGFADGQALEIRSDAGWRLAPTPERGWEKRKHPGDRWPAAKVIAAFGHAPWKYDAAKPPPIRVRTSPTPPPALQFWQTAWFQVAWLSVCGVIVAICLRLMGKLALQSKAQEILANERARIARDIHDEVGAGLTQLVLLGEVNQSELPADSPGRRQFNEVSEKARGLLRAMNEVVWVVNSQRDTLRDFASYVSKYAQTFLQTTPIRCRLDVGEEITAVPFDLAIRRNLFLAVKEALHNAVKHSGANELFLHIHHRAQGVVVVIEDNGKGFDPNTVDPQGNGLSNMAQRAESVGGACRITSRPEGGCRIELTAPLVQRPAGAGRRAWILSRFWQWRRRPRPPSLAKGAVAAASASPAQPVKTTT